MNCFFITLTTLLLLKRKQVYDDVIEESCISRTKVYNVYYVYES